MNKKRRVDDYVYFLKFIIIINGRCAGSDNDEKNVRQQQNKSNKEKMKRIIRKMMMIL